MFTTALKFWTLLSGIDCKIVQTYGHVDPAKVIHKRHYGSYMFQVAQAHLDEVPDIPMTEVQEQENVDYVYRLYFPDDGFVRMVKEALQHVPNMAFRLPGGSRLTRAHFDAIEGYLQQHEERDRREQEISQQLEAAEELNQIANSLHSSVLLVMAEQEVRPVSKMQQQSAPTTGKVPAASPTTQTTARTRVMEPTPSPVNPPSGRGGSATPLTLPRRGPTARPP